MNAACCVARKTQNMAAGTVRLQLGVLDSRVGCTFAIRKQNLLRTVCAASPSPRQRSHALPGCDGSLCVTALQGCTYGNITGQDDSALWDCLCPPLPELPGVLLENGSRALGTLWRDWNATAPGFWIAALLLLTLLFALAPLRRIFMPYHSKPEKPHHGLTYLHRKDIYSWCIIFITQFVLGDITGYRDENSISDAGR
jgi:hypothetical protein